MVFHRFQQLPAELRLRIWEGALDEARLIDGLLTENQKPVCYTIGPRGSQNHPTKLVTFEDVSLGYVCRESRQVLRRCGRLNRGRDFIPSTDVVYIDNPTTASYSSMRMIRHIALPPDFCYNVVRTEVMSHSHSDQIGLPRTSIQDRFPLQLLWLPELESITVIIPPLEKNMPYYADHFSTVKRPSFLRIVPYSEVQSIRIWGRSSYATSLRGSVDIKHQFLGPFIKDIGEAFEYQANWIFKATRLGNPRRKITVQAGVLQYLEGQFEDKTKLSSIYRKGEDLEERQSADQD